MHRTIRLGVFETVYPRSLLAASFADVVHSGFASVQFDLASAGVDVWNNSVSGEVIQSICTAAADTGVAIPALAGTYNMAHPDPAVRSAGLEGLRRLIAMAPALGASYVTLCSGSRSLESMWREHPDNGTRDAWNDSRYAIEAALVTAERYGIVLLIEPEPANVVGNARLARRMLDEVRHSHLKIVLDPANIVLSDLSRSPADVLSESFHLLGGDIDFAHAKDLDANGRFCAVGTGIVPWRHYRSLLDSIEYQGDVIFHTLTESDVPHALRTWHG